jgi:pimeloyl-ACP methyl ester carboxylesterase
VLQVLLMLVTALLTAGGITAAIAASFPAPGLFIPVLFDKANRYGSLHVYCIGTTRASLPTIFLVSSSAHGVVDFYGLQLYLNSVNGTDRRVCSFDHLGFGWSQDAFADQFSDYQFVYRLMLASGEPAPWNVVGWGQGGSALAYLASNHSSSIKSISFVESYPPGIEFDAYTYLNGLDQTATSRYRSAELLSRLQIARLILFLAIPWGLMSLFFPVSSQDADFSPPLRWTEYRVQMWKSKSWVSQLQGIQAMQARADSDDPVFSSAPLPATVPVFGIYCNVTTCAGAGCDAKIKTTAYYNTRKFAMLFALNSNASVTTDNQANCGLDLPLKKPRFAAESILNFLSKINA